MLDGVGGGFELGLLGVGEFGGVGFDLVDECQEGFGVVVGLGRGDGGVADGDGYVGGFGGEVDLRGGGEHAGEDLFEEELFLDF